MQAANSVILGFSDSSEFLHSSERITFEGCFGRVFSYSGLAALSHSFLKVYYHLNSTKYEGLEEDEIKKAADWWLTEVFLPSIPDLIRKEIEISTFTKEELTAVQDRWKQYKQIESAPLTGSGHGILALNTTPWLKLMANGEKLSANNLAILCMWMRDPQENPYYIVVAYRLWKKYKCLPVLAWYMAMTLPVINYVQSLSKMLGYGHGSFLKGRFLIQHAKNLEDFIQQCFDMKPEVYKNLWKKYADVTRLSRSWKADQTKSYFLSGNFGIESGYTTYYTAETAEQRELWQKSTRTYLGPGYENKLLMSLEEILAQFPQREKGVS